ncbi:MAG TPA: efflux RND transporter periplasmic adaptor subunit [Vicinamibacterales bacterium]|nr:efflux RND transporter periplasmic adaptor subunit [Vicinamibacterales bacterium]
MDRRRALLIGVLITAALVLLVAVTKTIRRSPPVTMSYGQVTTGDIVREVMTTGTLEPAKAVDAGAQVSGTVQSLYADFNSPVRAGQIIARLDPSTYDSEVNQAQAKLIQAQAEAQRATLMAKDAAIKRSRAEALAEQDLITTAELDTARLAAKEADADLASANAAVDFARAALKQAQVTRDRTIIRSPIDGIVVNRSVEIGQTVAARFESPVLFTIADLRQMRLLAEINEADVGSVKAGTPVAFEVESIAGRKFRGTVAEVRLQPVLDQASSSTPGAATAPAASGSTATASSSRAASSGTTAAAQSTSPSSSRAVGTTGTAGAAQPGQTSTAQSSSAQTPAAPAGAVVAYTAVVDVDNSQGELTPGNTAILTLPAARRTAAVRIPNRALAFRPSPDAFDAVKQEPPALAPTPAQSPSSHGDALDPSRGRPAYVWKFEGGKFVPIAVRVGLADETWTELIDGPVQPGDQLVTSAERVRAR